MYLRKETGGATLEYGGKRYTWKNDGDVLEVPAAFGEELLAIRGGGFSEAEPPAPPAKQAAPPKAEAKAAAPAAPAAAK